MLNFLMTALSILFLSSTAMAKNTVLVNVQSCRTTNGGKYGTKPTFGCQAFSPRVEVVGRCADLSKGKGCKLRKSFITNEKGSVELSLADGNYSFAVNSKDIFDKLVSRACKAVPPRPSIKDLRGGKHNISFTVKSSCAIP
jgi:hypothetical protein